MCNQVVPHSYMMKNSYIYFSIKLNLLNASFLFPKESSISTIYIYNNTNAESGRT